MTFPRSKANKQFNLIASLLFFLVISYLLFVYQIGLADSADYSRVIDRIGLGRPYKDPCLNFFNYFNSEYPIVSNLSIPLDFSQLIASLALILNKMFYSDARFSIYFLSAIYLLLYSAGFYLLLKNTEHYFKNGKVRVGFIFCAGLILSDILFIIYFNSFYQESVFIVAALFAFTISLSRKPNYNLLIIVLLILSISKMQNLVFVILPIGLMIQKWKSLNKPVVFTSFVIFSSILFVQLKTQHRTNEANIYEAVFMGVLLEADLETQKQVLSDFGLHDPNYLKNIGRGYWRSGNELYDYGLAKEFYNRVNNFTIIKMYLENPELFFKTGYKGLRELSTNSAQPEHLGNLSRDESVNDKMTVVKSLLGYYFNYVFIPLYLLISLYFFCLKRDFRSYRENKLIGMLIIFIPLVYIATFVSGGINDFVKHNLSLFLMCSMMILIFYLSVLNLGKRLDRQ